MKIIPKVLASLDDNVELADGLDYEYMNSDDTPSKNIKIEVELDDGSYHVIEAVLDNTRKGIYIKSAYQIKKRPRKSPMHIALNQRPKRTFRNLVVGLAFRPTVKRARYPPCQLLAQAFLMI